jgi:hypothetical protein
MNYGVECQLTELKEIEKTIREMHQEIAIGIFMNHVPYETIIEKEVKLFAIIDYAIEKYKAIFEYGIAYDEKRALNLLRSDITKWIEDEYKQEREVDDAN